MESQVNEKNNNGKKKHQGIKIAVLVIILVIGVECCFNTNTGDSQPVADSTNANKSTVTEETETETTTEETETEEDVDTEVMAEELAEEGIYITPGSTFYTIDGGYNSDRTLYLNVLYEDDNTMRYVGWGYDENGNIDESVHIDVLMKQTDDATKWLSEDGLWGASYFTDDIVQVGQESVWDSDFMGIFGRITDDSTSASTQEILTLGSDSEMREFIRDDSNIGKTVTFNAHVLNVIGDYIAVEALWADGSTTYYVLISNSNISTRLLDDDYITFTGVYEGFEHLDYPTFSTTSAELLQ